MPIAMYMKSNVDGIQNVNDNIPLYPSSTNTMKQCALKLRNITSKHKLSYDAEVEILVFLKELLPNTGKVDQVNTLKNKSKPPFSSTCCWDFYFVKDGYFMFHFCNSYISLLFNL
jgi:hypothetical protein